MDYCYLKLCFVKLLKFWNLGFRDLLGFNYVLWSCEILKLGFRIY